MSDSIQQVSAEFNDFDAYVEAVEDAEFEMTISSLELNHWKVQGIDLPGGLHVQKAFEGAGTVGICVNPPSGCNIFCHRDGVMLVNGEEMLPGSAFVIPPGSEFVLSNANAHRWFSVFVPEELMHDLGLNEDAQGKEHRHPRVVRNASLQTNRLWRQINRFLTSTAAGPEISSSATALTNFKNDLVRTLGEGFGRVVESPTTGRGRPVVTDRFMVARAIDAIEVSPDTGLSMKDLARVTGVSERSLRAGFCRYFGVSPKRYMQLRALNRARKRLSRARPEETTVTQVAADLGQWDIGRFAMRYRKTFGELPSATLRSRS